MKKLGLQDGPGAARAWGGPWSMGPVIGSRLPNPWWFRVEDLGHPLKFRASGWSWCCESLGWSLVHGLLDDPLASIAQGFPAH